MAKPSQRQPINGLLPSSRLSCLYKNIGVRPRCAAPRARYLGSGRSGFSTCHSSRPTCRCAGAAVPAQPWLTEHRRVARLEPACKANLSSSRRWVAGAALSRTTCPAGSPAWTHTDTSSWCR